ncbi:MAG: hypothetical protein MJH11_08715 [Lentisphaeria bacterium]|nr:hypothetical protein [Lentisphaeria bacterium]
MKLKLISRAFTCALLFLSANLWAQKSKAAAVDKKIANAALSHAATLLTQNTKDKTAQVLMNLASAVLPNDDDVVYIIAMLGKGTKPDELKNKMPLNKLIRLMLKQADELYITSKKSNIKTGELSHYYFRVLEVLKPKDPAVIVGLFKHGASGRN